MTKGRRIEIILDNMKCLLRYFTMDKEETEFIEKEICSHCSDYVHCVTTWRPWLKGEIKGILDSELKRGVIHERD